MPYSIDKRLINLAKTRVARSFDSIGGRADERRDLLAGIETIARELPNRENVWQVETMLLSDSDGLSTRVIGRRYESYPCADGLALSYVKPYWDRGWRNLFKSEATYDTLSWFLLFAGQYVGRSDFAQLLMIVWEKDGRILQRFSDKMIMRHYNRTGLNESIKSALDDAQKHAFEEWEYRGKVGKHRAISSKWTSRNTLDPFLHQGVFYYLRAQDLMEKNFMMEALVAFDCMLQSIEGLIRSRHRPPRNLRRSQVIQYLNLPQKYVKLSEYMYFLRNNFGAHAGGWRWWDQDGMLDEETMLSIARLATRVLSVAADLEPSVRAVNPSPVHWGLWFFENFEMLWDANWFDRIDRFHRQEI